MMAGVARWLASVPRHVLSRAVNADHRLKLPAIFWFENVEIMAGPFWLREFRQRYLYDLGYSSSTNRKRDSKDALRRS